MYKAMLYMQFAWPLFCDFVMLLASDGSDVIVMSQGDLGFDDHRFIAESCKLEVCRQ